MQQDQKITKHFTILDLCGNAIGTIWAHEVEESKDRFHFYVDGVLVTSLWKDCASYREHVERLRYNRSARLALNGERLALSVSGVGRAISCRQV